MTESQKKELAEWMGWTIFKGEGVPGDHFGFDPNGYDGIDSEEWNPDTDHTQFAEVWKQLGQTKRERIEDMVVQITEESFSMNLLFNLPEVMYAVLTELGIK